MKRGLNIQINFNNRAVYTFVAFIVLSIIGIGVFAFGTSTPSTLGHSAGELDLRGGVNGDAVFNGDVRITGLVSCDTIDTDISGNLVCGTDQSSDNDWVISGTDMYSGVSGKVGIGNPNPTQKLDVNGNVVGNNIRGKICPSGQFVKGFDINGDILCDVDETSTGTVVDDCDPLAGTVCCGFCSSAGCEVMGVIDCSGFCSGYACEPSGTN